MKVERELELRKHLEARYLVRDQETMQIIRDSYVRVPLVTSVESIRQTITNHVRASCGEYPRCYVEGFALYLVSPKSGAAVRLTSCNEWIYIMSGEHVGHAEYFTKELAQYK